MNDAGRPREEEAAGHRDHKKRLRARASLRVLARHAGGGKEARQRSAPRAMYGAALRRYGIRAPARRRGDTEPEQRYISRRIQNNRFTAKHQGSNLSIQRYAEPTVNQAVSRYAYTARHAARVMRRRAKRGARAAQKMLAAYALEAARQVAVRQRNTLHAAATLA